MGVVVGRGGGEGRRGRGGHQGGEERSILGNFGVCWPKRLATLNSLTRNKHKVVVLGLGSRVKGLGIKVQGFRFFRFFFGVFGFKV